MVQTYQNGKNIPNGQQTIPNGHKICIPNGRKIDKMVIKYTNVVNSKALPNSPKLGFLV
jgi:hypothetical protein